MAGKRRVNIIFSDNGSGLSRDAVVLRDALERTGHAPSLSPLAPRKYPWAINYIPEIAQHAVRETIQVLQRSVARRTRLWDINIFLERLVPEYFDTAGANCLFPHQEWLTEGDRHRLREVDLVLFKTKHAFDLLSKETKAAALVGFTTVDRRDASVRRIPRTALHVAGWNPHKGTAAILASWSARPDWPEIRVVTQLKGLTGECRNVRVFNTRITDRALRSLQNECTVHVCPSEVEGFGHTLVEAMSCGAVTVTTAAPPMNEVITPEEGFLVPYSRTEPMGAGTRYLVDADSLADVMNRVWTLDSGTFEQLSKAARARFERMQSSFHDSLVTALSGI